MNKFEQVPSFGHPMLVLEDGVTVQRDPISTTTRCHYQGTGTGELGHERPCTVRSHAGGGGWYSVVPCLREPGPVLRWKVSSGGSVQ